MTQNCINTKNPVVQVVYANKTSYQHCTTAMPGDDTIPQKTEGDEVLTCSITPTETTNILVIEFIVMTYQSGAGDVSAALFQDTTAGALATTWISNLNALATNSTLKHVMTAGTTSSTTFKIRIGHSAPGSVDINGPGGRWYGGTASTLLTITEYKG